jgi:hypothetical protein
VSCPQRAYSLVDSLASLNAKDAAFVDIVREVLSTAMPAPHGPVPLQYQDTSAKQRNVHIAAVIEQRCKVRSMGMKFTDSVND